MVETPVIPPKTAHNERVRNRSDIKRLDRTFELKNGYQTNSEKKWHWFAALAMDIWSFLQGVYGWGDRLNDGEADSVLRRLSK